MRNQIEAGYDDDDDEDHDHDGYSDNKLGWFMLMVTIVSIVNLFIFTFLMTAVCSNCCGAHYKSRETRCSMSGEQVSYYTLAIYSLV